DRVLHDVAEPALVSLLGDNEVHPRAQLDLLAALGGRDEGGVHTRFRLRAALPEREGRAIAVFYHRGKGVFGPRVALWPLRARTRVGWSCIRENSADWRAQPLNSHEFS